MKRNITIGVDSFSPEQFIPIAQKYTTFSTQFTGYVDYDGQKINRFVTGLYLDPFLNDATFRNDLEKLFIDLYENASAQAKNKDFLFVMNFLNLPEREEAPKSFDFEAWLHVETADDIRGSLDALALYIKSLKKTDNPLREYNIETLNKPVGEGWMQG